MQQYVQSMDRINTSKQKKQKHAFFVKKGKRQESGEIILSASLIYILFGTKILLNKMISKELYCQA